MKIYNGYERLPRNYTLDTDEYEYTMSNGYLLLNKSDQEVVFDVFFREVPNQGGYAIMAGLDKVIPFIQNFHFDERDIAYFKKRGYGEEFLQACRNYRFTGDIYAIPDGTPVFPNEPILTVKAPIMDAQMVETAILAILNGAMEHATGARRIVEAAPEGVGVMEFGSRRADGNEASIDAALYGVMAGCIGTSNSKAANMINTVAMGTMAHSWIESFDSEYEAFLAYARIYPNDCILLVDTYNTLVSGIPNAIKVAKEYLIPNGYRLKGIRIDSGDLTYLSKEARKMLDAAGLTDAGICLSNGLTDRKIRSLIDQGACFNSLGVGDNISKPEGRMGCVYKESAIKKNGIWIPKIKLSNDVIKITNPDYKKLYRAYDKDSGMAIADIMTRQDEVIKDKELLIVDPTNAMKRKVINNFELRTLQVPIFIRGELVYDDLDIWDIRKYCDEQMATLYPEVKRIDMPHEYYVDGTEAYVNFKNEMIGKVRKLARK